LCATLALPAVVLLVMTTSAGTGPAVHRMVIGRSVRDRPIRAWEVGQATGSRRVLVVGCVHGNEPAGKAITRRLRRAQLRPGTVLLIVDEFNPDGCAAGTRQNARGVDLNRNSSWRWRPLDRPGGTYYSGPRPRSEPESRAIVRFVKRFRPSISIWYHQHARLVVRSGGDPRIERRYARLVGLPFRRFGGPPPGSITSWQNAAFPAGTAFVVELPGGRLSSRAVDRHVHAVLELAAGH
jgi:murein peptide amidase A